jgi:hypothetical protein
MNIFLKTLPVLFILLFYSTTIYAQSFNDNYSCIKTIMVGTTGGKCVRKGDTALHYNGIIGAGNLGYVKTFSSNFNFAFKTNLDLIYVSRIGAISFGGGFYGFIKQKIEVNSTEKTSVGSTLFYTRVGYLIPFKKKGFVGGFINYGSASQQSGVYSNGNAGVEAEIGYPFYIAKKKYNKVNFSGVLNFQYINLDGIDYSNISLSLRVSVLQFWKR